MLEDNVMIFRQLGQRDFPVEQPRAIGRLAASVGYGGLLLIDQIFERNEAQRAAMFHHRQRCMGPLFLEQCEQLGRYRGGGHARQWPVRVCKPSTLPTIRAPMKPLTWKTPPMSSSDRPRAPVHRLLTISR
ncbi:hypothetical protein [Sphingobium cupriresistens]|uniref:hypothetical protein n=1 Tax=Sphingobium cupriresistens TaxID=1132417 RepID=UPI003BF5937B